MSAADFFTEDGRIAVGVEVVVLELEGESYFFGKLVEHFGICSRCVGEETAHLCGAAEEHRGFEADHFEVFRFGDLTARFEIDVVLLSFADADGAVGEQAQDLFSASHGALCDEAIGQEKHGVAGEYGGVFVPTGVHGGASAAHVGVVHEIVVHEGVVVVHFDADRRGHGRHVVAVIEREGREQKHGAEPLPAAGEYETNGVVKSFGTLRIGQCRQGVFNVL